MTLSRRKALSIVGGGVVLAAGAGITGFATTRSPTEALKPWSIAGNYDDPRLNALSYALLAPNPHNLQPWQVRLDGDDAFTLIHDQDRRLPETDPLDRQIMIGFGCFLEQMVLAAGAAGHDVKLTLFPEGEDGPVARAAFGTAGKADPLAAHILDRRSCKQPYEDRAVSDEIAARLSDYADIHTDEPMVETLRELTWQALQVELTTPRTMQESIDVMRMGKSEINATPDGLPIGGAFFEGLMLAGLLSREAMKDPDSVSFRQALTSFEQLLRATPAYAVLTTPGNSRQDQIATGRRWLRLNLATTGLGLGLHPVSQALQEYPEMAPHFSQAHALLAPPGHTVQMLGRLGYGPASPRTPRWPLEAKLVEG